MRFKDELQKEIYYISQIDYCYWQISEIAKEKYIPVDPITNLINQVTGFTKAQDKSKILELIYLMGVIIRCKTKLGYEVDNDVQFKEKLRGIKK